MTHCKHGIMSGCCAICLGLSEGSTSPPSTPAPDWLKTIRVDKYSGNSPRASVAKEDEANNRFYYGHIEIENGP